MTDLKCRSVRCMYISIVSSVEYSGRVKAMRHYRSKTLERIPRPGPTEPLLHRTTSVCPDIFILHCYLFILYYQLFNLNLFLVLQMMVNQILPYTRA